MGLAAFDLYMICLNFSSIIVVYGVYIYKAHKHLCTNTKHIFYLNELRVISHKQLLLKLWQKFRIKNASFYVWEVHMYRIGKIVYDLSNIGVIHSFSNVRDQTTLSRTARVFESFWQIINFSLWS